jgi:SAM-dependent methyltransferase
VIVREFADHFSRAAIGYAAYRPQYPEGLFAAIAAASPFCDRVWDCATGTGQAAHGLAQHFEVVLASDASAGQVRAASPHPQIRYFVARAEAVPLRSRSVGMVTVAQALHWLELPEFYAEARRVLRPGGLLVVWTYGNQRVDGGPVDKALAHFYDRVIGSYWPPERRWVETGYRTLRFPFQEIPIQSPAMVVEWNLDQLLGYIGTWSAVVRCREVTGTDPLTRLAARLLPAWGDPSAARRIEWPLSVRAGK